MSEHDLRDRALAHYERVRLRVALPWAIPGILLSYLVQPHDGPFWDWVPGCALALLCVGFAWRGRGLNRSLLPGFAAGAMTWVAPLMLGCPARACSSDCASRCLTIATAIGVLSSFVIGRWFGRKTVLGAMAIAALSFLIVC